VGKDGRVRVLDFGLALADRTGQMDARSGTLAGTPAYMAPEQLSGTPADARSDQFAFCVTLYQALYGERPFAGTAPAEIEAEILAGRVRAPPAGSRVPARLREVMLRGLSARPEDRFPDMAACLAALSRDPRVRARRFVVAGFAVALASIIGVIARQTNASRMQVCHGGSESVQRVWGEEAHRRGRETFAKLGDAFASSSWNLVEAALDRYGAELAAARDDACAATRMRGEQSERVMDARMECLDDRLRDLSALAIQLRETTLETVPKAVEAAHGLTPISVCAHGARLADAPAPPSGPESSRRLTTFRDELARAKSLHALGDFKGALAEVEGQLEAVRAFGYTPLLHDYLVLLSKLRHAVQDEPGAADAAHEAVWTAEEARDDAGVAEGWTYIARIELLASRKLEGARALRHARAALDRAGGRDDLAIDVELVELRLARLDGRLADALAHGERALEQQRRFDPDAQMLGEALVEVGAILREQGRYADAVTETRRALAHFEHIVGPEHPDVGNTLNALGMAQWEGGALDDAAQSYLRALDIRKKRFGPESSLVATVHNNLGLIYVDLARNADALAEFETASAIWEAKLGPGHVNVGIAADNIGVALGRLHRAQESLAAHQRALGILEAAAGPDSADVGFALVNVGSALLDLHRPRAALPFLERCVALRERRDCAPRDRALSQFKLARALWEGGGDKHRAWELAQLARATWAGDAKAKQRLDEVDAWLQAQSGPP
jgi:tetratricopeptide (TPR) repeat protein